MRIVMVCTGNTCRSPMAEALMRDALARRGIEGVEVYSAGTFAQSGQPASPDAVRQMAHMGHDITAHRAQNIGDVPLDGALVLCMTDAHALHVKRQTQTASVHALMAHAGLGGIITDPIGMGPEAYKQCALQMKRAIDIIADQIEEERQHVSV